MKQGLAKNLQTRDPSVMHIVQATSPVRRGKKNNPAEGMAKLMVITKLIRVICKQGVAKKL